MLYAKIADAAQLINELATKGAKRPLPDASDDNRLRIMAKYLQGLIRLPVLAAPTEARHTTLTSLPIELVVLVLDNLDQGDVHALALTCRYLSAPAIQRLNEHPTLGDVLKGDSFRSGYRENILDRLPAIKSLTCTRWSGWSAWIARFAALPNVETASVSDQTRDIKLDRLLDIIAYWPRLRSLSIDGLCHFNASRATHHKPNLQIVDLHLRGHLGLPAFGSCDYLKGLPLVLPNVRRLFIDARSAELELDVLDPFDGFARLESLTLVAGGARGYCSWKPPNLRLVISKLRHVTLIGFNLATCVLSPGGALCVSNARLETLVVMNIGTWDQIKPFMKRLAHGTFPSLRRLLLVRNRANAQRGMTRGVPTDHLPLLQAQGFGGHLCSRVIHVERPPPERWWLGSAASRRAQQARAFCTCSPLDMDIEGVKVDIDGAWTSCATRSAMGRDATDF